MVNSSVNVVEFGAELRGGVKSIQSGKNNTRLKDQKQHDELIRVVYLLLLACGNCQLIMILSVILNIKKSAI